MNTQAIIKPQSETGICNAVREAAEKGAAFEIVGHGTKRGYGRPTEANFLLDTSALSGIVKYEPEELVIAVRAATPIAEIEAALSARNQMLGFEPADWGKLFGAEPERATIAGTACANACGSRRVKAGAVRDHVIGCRFVNGQGEAIKAGGPVIKNVTGFDITRLMCGAFGTLGVLTELTLRVTPKPPRSEALTISCSAAEGLRVLREAARLPLDPTGLAYIPAPGANAEGMAVIRVEGAQEPVNDKLDVLQKQFAGRDARVIGSDATNKIFRDLSDGAPFRDIATDVWRLCVPPSAAHEALQASKAQIWYADWAGGLLWLGLQASAEVAGLLRAITAKVGGHATLMRAGQKARGSLDVFEPEAQAHSKLTRAVKAAFDPKSIFNRGRMYKDI